MPPWNGLIEIRQNSVRIPNQTIKTFADKKNE